MKSGMTFNLLIFVILLILIVDNSIYAQNWPMLNLNKERTSWASEENVLYPPLQQKNEFQIKSAGTSISYVTYFNNLLSLAVANYPNTLEVVDVTSGDTLWTFGVPDSKASMNFVCAQNDSLIFAGGQQGVGLYALDRETGEQKWSKPIGTLFTKNVMLDNDYAYVLGDSLYCLSVKNGSTVWSYNIKIQATPAIDDLYVYVVGEYKIQIFDKLTGELVWWKPSSVCTTGGITVDDHCFYTQSNDTIFAFNKDSRDIKWFYHTPGDTIQYEAQNSIAITDSKLCFTIKGNGDGNGQLVTLDKVSGKFLWDQTFAGNYVFAPTIANGVVYIVPLYEAALYGFDLENGTQLFYDNSASYKNQPIVANHQLYVASRSKVFAFGNNETNIDNFDNASFQNFELMQNYPNPFNPKTTIKFTLPKNAFTTLTIYDNLGKKMSTLINAEKSSGLHSINFDGSDFPSGLYYYRLVTSAFASTKKLLLLK